MMSYIELEVEHRYEGAFVGRHHFKPGQEVTIGSERECGIRLLGENISTMHAYLENDSDEWFIRDLGSKGGTWVKKLSIVEHIVKNTVTVQIGKHNLKLIPKEIKNDLFMSGQQFNNEAFDNANCEYQQVIVRKNNLVISSKLIGKNDPFLYVHGTKVNTLKAPEGVGWVESKFDDVVIQQRVVRTLKMVASNQEKIKTLWDPNLKLPLMSAVVFMLMFFSGLFIYQNLEMEQEPELKKIIKNKYTRMIYDAKHTKKQRAKASNLKNKFVSKNANPSAASKSKKTTVVKRTKTKNVVKVISNIKKMGLSKLIGKISKRAAKNAFHIQTKGRVPSSATGAASAFKGSADVSAPNAKSAKSFKLAGVTAAGNGSGIKGNSGTMASGGVATGTVGILEEETEITGGLAREIISKYIQSKIGQIRYCYERQLSANPDLYGKVVVGFTIGSSGQIMAKNVKTTSLNNAMVEGCMLRRIARWKFPEPDGGTLVKVAYPFLFKSSN